MNISIDKIKSLALKKARTFLFEFTGEDDSHDLNLLVYRIDDKTKKVTCIVNCGRAKKAEMPADLIVVLTYKELREEN